MAMETEKGNQKEEIQMGWPRIITGIGGKQLELEYIFGGRVNRTH